MALAFRNVAASPADDVTTWPYEALVSALERGLVPDWRPILDEIGRQPWGPLARRVEDYVSYSTSPGVAALFGRAVTSARAEADRRDRAEVARRVRDAVATSGLTSARFAELIGTSASRLSTYASGAVTPSAALLVRMERASGQSSRAERSSAPR
ncbi:MAG: helix-turn-helix domain-containing protein, partial [Candidatus Nanopelagicales bacterium]